MPDRQAADKIRAAGAVLWRPAGRGVQVALIHHPKYDDWGLAKGKLEPGEHPLLAAVREVAEETGLRITLGLHLPPVRYLVEGEPKVVDYWAARVDASCGTFTPNHEVDRLDWVASSRAAARLSYDHDAALLAQFIAAPRPTVPIIFVRHASAGSKSDWHKDDSLRPLDSRGTRQARALSAVLRCFGVARVLSSPAERCLATVRPYAAGTGGEVAAIPEFGLPPAPPKKGTSTRAGGDQARAQAQAQAAAAIAAAAAGSGPVVICAHRENLPALVGAVCDHLGAAPPGGPPLRKGGFLVLHRAGGRLAGAERHHPEEVRLSPRSGRRGGRLPVEGGRERTLQDQQPPLDLGSGAAAVAAEAVAGQHAMARDDDRNGIGTHDLADRARGELVTLGPQARPPGEPAVAGGPPVAH